MSRKKDKQSSEANVQILKDQLKGNNNAILLSWYWHTNANLLGPKWIYTYMQMYTYIRVGCINTLRLECGAHRRGLMNNKLISEVIVSEFDTHWVFRTCYHVQYELVVAFVEK